MNTQTKKRHGFRSGTAVVELAICLPVMALITFATIEICSAIYLKQTLEIACYEGARVAIAPAKQSRNAQRGAERIVKERRVVNCSITVSPSSPDRAKVGEAITVTATAPFAGNTLFSYGFLSGSNVTCSATMIKE